MAGDDASSAPPATGPWVELSARLQRVAAARTGRTDLVLRISPDLAPDPAGWSGWYRHDLAEIRLPASSVLGEHTDPRGVDVTTLSGRRANPTLSGALSLTTAHAVHTMWALPTDLDATLTAAIDLLERLRVVRVHLAEHAADRRWIRAAASQAIAGPDRGSSSTWGAIGTLGLELTGVLSPEESRIARTSLTSAFAPETVSALEQILSDGSALADGAAEELRTHAERLAAALGTARSPSDDDQPGDGQQAEDMRSALDGLRDRDSRADRPSRWIVPREEDLQLAERDLARAAATATFSGPPDEAGTIHREPTPELRSAARRLAGALRRARYRAADLTLEASATPPGRLRLAEAMRGQAQRAAGAEVTARPWLQSRRRTVDMPPLRVGLSWDISRSRSALHARMADLAWALSWAMHHVDGELAAVAWNSRTHAVQWPGRAPVEVVEPPCSGNSSACPQSLRALEGALRLHGRLGARVVIVTTDGQVSNRRMIGTEIHRLVHSGVSVLWVTPQKDPKAPAGAVNIALSDPDTLVPTLGDAICQLLARAGG